MLTLHQRLSPRIFSPLAVVWHKNASEDAEEHFFCESCSLSHGRLPAPPPLSSLFLPPLGLNTPDVISTHINRNVFCLRSLMFVPCSEGLGSTSTALITPFPFFSELYSLPYFTVLFFFF